MNRINRNITMILLYTQEIDRIDNGDGTENVTIQALQPVSEEQKRYYRIVVIQE